ncbi:hypothetical protein [Phaeospirillum tilakii]|uniref:Uncharacterized protein n=1 Tax=Phaeospirillum tilakii TaxID=741673 RepID=A0ABW5C9S7_9PROT
MSGQSLAQAVNTPAIWPTPRAGDGDKWSARKQRDDSLTQQAMAWPTPAARDWRAPNSAASHDRRNEGSGRGQQLPNFVEHRFSSLPAPGTSDGPTSSPNGQTSRRRLNPQFAEWLMQWPIGWTACDSSATAFARWKQRSRSALSALLSRPAIEADGQLRLFGEAAE